MNRKIFCLHNGVGLTAAIASYGKKYLRNGAVLSYHQLQFRSEPFPPETTEWSLNDLRITLTYNMLIYPFYVPLSSGRAFREFHTQLYMENIRPFDALLIRNNDNYQTSSRVIPDCKR